MKEKIKSSNSVEFTETKFKKLQKPLVYIKSNLIDTGGGMYFTVYYLTEINNIITNSNNITLRKVNAKSYEFDKI